MPESGQHEPEKKALVDVVMVDVLVASAESNKETKVPNPFEFISEIREMNRSLTQRLDMIIERLDKLVELENGREAWWEKKWYGDGK